MITIARSTRLPRWRAVPDWRERLHRNLSRPSTGRWEPIADQRGTIAFDTVDVYDVTGRLVSSSPQ